MNNYELQQNQQFYNYYIKFLGISANFIKITSAVKCHSAHSICQAHLKRLNFDQSLLIFSDDSKMLEEQFEDALKLLCLDVSFIGFI